MPRLSISPMPVLAALVLAACRDDTTEPTDPMSAVAATAAVWTQITVGGQHTCAIASGARAYCWGYAESGRLGTGTTALYQASPTRVSGGLQFAQISAGTEHTCAVTTAQKAYCWGSDLFRQLGNGTTSSRSAPVPVAGGRLFTQIRAGAWHTCALTPAGKAFCWGGNQYGALGDGTTTTRTTPVAVLGGLTFRRLMVGGLHTCGVTTSDKAYCWGRGAEGQLGTGLQKNNMKPVLVSGGLAWKAVLPGTNHTCGITTADKAYCWGSYRTDTFTGLGTGDNSDGTLAPKAVAGTRTWRQLTAGSLHTCGVTLANIPFCWGLNFTGQNGDGTANNASGAPTRVAGNLNFTGMATGVERLREFDSPVAQHTCGITSDGRIYCWGDNQYGQLGTGLASPDQFRSLVPVRAKMPV
jgi:alpha-tubulin suppressor-like RCC1 family protein